MQKVAETQKKEKDGGGLNFFGFYQVSNENRFGDLKKRREKKKRSSCIIACACASARALPPFVPPEFGLRLDQKAGGTVAD